ncbi:hypothetical protein BUALT_Bualt12G0063800 [Buddleja alternifolia]|uniref:Uncharacterized protein n=1 Tax=Buddleja alternifolia TaxID=168488 RepID=A0AAV6WZJ2_9LAMI|nr:hypothetical protein BUALT_Bualt12G0063800 [Buddleja alternifolia]
MEDLTEDKKLIASEMLVKSADDLRLFFILTVERKINAPTLPTEIIILSSGDEDESENDFLYPIVNVIQVDDDEEGEGSTTSNYVGEGKMLVNVLLDPTDENSTNVKSPQYKFGPWGSSDITPTKPLTVVNLLMPKKKRPLKIHCQPQQIMKKLKFP